MKRTSVLVFLFVCACAAQATDTLQGEIEPEDGVDLSRLVVHIENSRSMTQPEKALVSPNGTFAIRDVTPGTYMLRVQDVAGNDITSQYVTVNGMPGPISVKLPAKKADPTGQSVSVARLRHKPNRQAARDVLKAQKLGAAGNHEQAAALLEKAVALDGEYSEAVGNLGAEYAMLGRFAEAEPVMRRAVTLDPATASHQSNLALVLAHLNKVEEAEGWARRAVALDGSNAKCHYVLGSVLAMRSETRPASVAELTAAARELPSAHQTLATVYDTMGKRDLARDERERYENERTDK